MRNEPKRDTSHSCAKLPCVQFYAWRSKNYDTSIKFPSWISFSHRLFLIFKPPSSLRNAVDWFGLNNQHVSSWTTKVTMPWVIRRKSSSRKTVYALSVFWFFRQHNSKSSLSPNKQKYFYIYLKYCITHKSNNINLFFFGWAIWRGFPSRKIDPSFLGKKGVTGVKANLTAIPNVARKVPQKIMSR